ncbi:MAG TPA: transposase, partial [Candidatus Megaira endosymbiont of Nemacystus decipiens]|nr:transposase [Candidatus Megaera endosymbiont of Nemacystus decipiens]
MSFCLSPGNIDDRKPMENLFKNLKGTACGDKGYISKSKAQTLFEKGLNFITKTKANMKKIVRSNFEKYLLAQRSIVETLIQQLKSICLIEHSRHRKPDNFLANTLSALIAYTIKPRKPSINQRFLGDTGSRLTSN